MGSSRGGEGCLQTGRAKFVVNTGDLVWWGKQGSKPSDSPYWKLVNEDVLKQLLKPDREMEKAGLPGRRLSRRRQSRNAWNDSGR